MSNNEQNTNHNEKVEKNSPGTENPQQEEQPGFFRKYIWYIVFFIAFRIGSSLMSKENTNDPKLTGVIEEGTKFDINFYLTTKDHYTSIKDLEPIYTIKDMIYSYKNFSSNSLENEINITYNLSYLYRRKNHKNSRLYLMSEIKLDTDVYKRLNRYHGLTKEDLIRSINILKYVEDLTGLLNSGKDIDDISVGKDFKKNIDSALENKTMNKKDADGKFLETPIPKLYYKNNFYLYIVKTEKQEGLTIFQTYNMLRLPLRVNTQQMEYMPIMAISDFWSMDSELTQINKTENGLFTFRLHLSFNYIKSFFFNNMIGIQINENMMSEKLAISGTKDMLVELIKNNFIFYLIILFTVNTLHTIFSYLGFSSDISYYKNLKKLDGVYTKYIYFNIFYMFITLIYILLQGANFLVKINCSYLL